MTRQQDAPWWASGSDGLGEEDPLTSHRRARRTEEGHGGERTTERDAGATGPAPAWWQEASLALGALARAAGQVRPSSHADDPEGDGAELRHGTADELCEVCPVCVGLRALERSRPELVGHLTEALRHLTLAGRAFADAHGEERSDRAPDGGLERIDLDGE